MPQGSCIGQTIQAVIFGSNVQLVRCPAPDHCIRHTRPKHAHTQVYRYFLQPRRDPPSARWGILFLTALLITHLVLCNYQTVRVIMYHDRKVPVVLFKDWVRACPAACSPRTCIVELDCGSDGSGCTT